MESIETTVIHQLVADQIVQFKETGYFEFASGIKSPIYTDLRLTVSYVHLRNSIADALAKLIKEKYPNADVIGGVATAGIPHAALVADRLGDPMIYVRSKPKDHGTSKQIEGRMNQNDQVVLIDDLISTGGSVIKAAQAVQREGYQVAGVVSIFSYGFPDAEKNFKEAGLDFAPLVTYAEVLKELLREQRITEAKFNSLNKWHRDPWNWAG
ncbi:orotate phosphoribosyltransferase [Fructilactobacillus vespulae]|uniref:orotate phosphoribosyltransferase n=1 Tax=Fructilactobacillus vespulae TaxID=1249630 RepID=UPI0039B5972A